MSKYYKSSASAGGDRHMYRCNKVKFRGKQCAARIYLLYSSKNNTVQLFRSTADHDHDQNVNKITDLSDDVKHEIRTMYEYGVTKPKQIHINLIKKNFGQQNENHLNHFLTKLRTEKYGQNNIDMNTLQNWLIENSAVPSINSQPFVVDYKISKRNEKPYFRFFISLPSHIKSQEIRAKFLFDFDKMQTILRKNLNWLTRKVDKTSLNR